jgi:transcriptional regulator with XRE-family HTH domain
MIRAMETFGQRLRKFRMAKNLSLQQLADAVGASKAHVWDLETGKTKNPSLSLLTEFSRALGVSIKALVGETEDTEDSTLAPLFRDLRGLDEADIQMIKSLTDQLRARSDGKKSGD